MCYIIDCLLLFIDNIDVICRLRPLIKDDGDSPPADLQLDPSNDCVINAMYRSRLKTYEVNHILDSTASQEQVIILDSLIIIIVGLGFNNIVFVIWLSIIQLVNTIKFE